MELLSAFMGAVIGAIVSFALSEWSRRKNEREKVIEAIKSEFRLNHEVAKAVLANGANSGVNTASDWTEIIPFSDTAWTSIVSSGALSQIDTDLIEELFRTYARIRSANFVAVKIQAGRYEPREGSEYKKRVEQVDAELQQVLSQLESK